MKTPVALLNLWHQPFRTFVSTSGVTFALLLVFAQLGFQGAVSNTATNTLERLNFDLMIRSMHYAHIFEPDQFDRNYLTLARNTPGVADVAPFWAIVHNWQRTTLGGSPSDTSPIRPIAVMGIDPDRPAFRSEDIVEMVETGRLQVDDQMLIDDLTHAEYGPADGVRFGPQDINSEAEIGGRRFRISGIFRLGTGLAANGSAIINDRGFAKISPWNPQDSVSLGLIRLDAGQDAGTVQQKLMQQFQTSTFKSSNDLDDPRYDSPSQAVAVLSRDEVLDAERHRWLWQTPIGLIFQLGVVISFFVGATIVYMVLATDVTEKLPEYATLLAMGYPRIFLAGIVMTQAVLLAVLGFVCSWLFAEFLYRVASSFSGIAMSMESSRTTIVFLLGLAMCSLSGLLAMRKLWKAEPANLF